MKKILSILILLFMACPVFAAVTQNKAVTAQTPQLEAYQFTHSSSAGTMETVYTGGTNGSKVTSLFASSTDTSNRVLTCQVYNGSTSYIGTTVTVAATAGDAAGVPPQNVMGIGPSAIWPGLPIDSDGNPFIFLPTSSWTLQCTVTSTITSSDFVNVVASGEDF